MSLPPYNHTRNPALEKEEEYKEYPAPSVPLITHSGVIEKRKTTDRSLIRSQPPHSEVEFQYLPLFPSSGSTIVSQKSSKMKKIRKTASSEEKKINDCSSKVTDDEIKINKLVNNDEESMNKISSENENIQKVEKEKDSESICSNRSKNSKRSFRKNRESSTKSNVSNESVCSRQSGKSGVTVSSGRSTMKNINNDKDRKSRRAFSSATEFRRIANGLDEEDLFPHRRR